VQTRQRLLGLREIPRRRILDVAVGALHKLPGGLERTRVVQGVHLRREGVRETQSDVLERRVVLGHERRAAGVRDEAVTVLADHVEQAADEVAPVVGEVAVVALHHRLERDGAVGAELHVAQEVVAVGVDTEALDELGRGHRVALGLAHLLALGEQEAVREHALGERQAHGQQHRGPDHAVEPDDVLAHEVDLRGPAASELLGTVGVAVADGGDVVEERVEPDVDGVVGVEGKRDAPLHVGARDREVAQAALHKRQHLVAPRVRTDEARVGIVVGQQLVLVRRQLEEPALLVHDLERAVARRAGVALRGLLGGVEGLAGDAVEALVGSLVDVAAVVEDLDERRHAALVTRLGGTYEVVVGDVEQAPGLLIARRHGVGPLLRRHVVGGRGLLDLLAVLVQSGEEVHVIAEKAPVARERIAGDRRVRGTEVRNRVHVVDG